MCHITDLVSLPLLTTMDKLYLDSVSKVNRLKQEKEHLVKQLKRLQELSNN